MNHDDKFAAMKWFYCIIACLERDFHPHRITTVRTTFTPYFCLWVRSPPYMKMNRMEHPKNRFCRRAAACPSAIWKWLSPLLINESLLLPRSYLNMKGDVNTNGIPRYNQSVGSQWMQTSATPSISRIIRRNHSCIKTRGNCRRSIQGREWGVDVVSAIIRTW